MNMPLSVFDLFKIGIGPSSSHTVGPMKAAYRFVEKLDRDQLLGQVGLLQVELFGSLGLTGIGHATDTAILLGLHGELPDQIEPEKIPKIIQMIHEDHLIDLFGKQPIRFDPDIHLIFHRDQTLSYHSNGMRFTAIDRAGQILRVEDYYSIGGGFIVGPGETSRSNDAAATVPYPFSSAAELLETCRRNNLKISDLAWKNELAVRSETDIRSGLKKIWETMNSCIERGCHTEGKLPGNLQVQRRAAKLHQSLTTSTSTDPLKMLDWVSLFAIAVNEENAAGGKVVTAPTNGAAGIIPAVLAYYVRFIPGANEDGIERFLLTAAAIGMLYKLNASISGAEVGCQGEVGVACSMASAGLAEVLGGTLEQVENAAEIGMEHNLGLTCDPVGGLVQIPCIERNAMGAIKAINATRLALQGDGQHYVSLDQVIQTMRRTGADMSTKYKETSQGGLAVSLAEC
jgi:L-serine dehydratase